jgi:predicted MFS family arabinose efflux permease
MRMERPGPSPGSGPNVNAGPPEPRAALWALFAGNFVIGTGILLPAGMLNDLSAGLAVTAATAGLLMLASGLVIGFGAPVFATLTSTMDRRLLLAASLALYAVGHALSAVVPDFSTLLILRVLTVVSAGIFTPQAAACVGLIVRPERRAACIAFIFIGWSVASVAGVPLGSLIGAWVGWRSAFGLMALLSLLALLFVWQTIPRGLHAERLSFAAWRDVLTNPVLLCVLLVTLASASGQFTLFSYLAPFFKTTLALSPASFAILLALIGAAGVAGNTVASRIVATFGAPIIILTALVGIFAGLVLIGLFPSNFIIAALGGMLWGLGTFSSNSLQQSRLVTLAPALAGASVALNTSTIYLGQAVGAGTGGWLISHDVLTFIPWAGAAFLIIAIAATIIAPKLARSTA